MHVKQLHSPELCLLFAMKGQEKTKHQLLLEQTLPCAGMGMHSVLLL
jgi:hypothetical protein